MGGRVGSGRGLRLGIRADVNEEVKFLCTFKKKSGVGVSGQRGGGGESGWI